MSSTDIGISCPACDFNVINVSFNAIRENKILAKISEFTVLKAIEDVQGHFRHSSKTTFI